MEDDKALEHLLKIEAEAAALVNDAQVEADRRIQENEKKNRAVHEQRFRTESEGREAALKQEKDRLKKQYQVSLEEYRKEISGISVDTERFSALFDRLFAEEG
ncbi:MAG: hypothetical protein LBG91_01320 [Treponema sp.]|nr:hypothetical protein [Treponema sp.]